MKKKLIKSLVYTAAAVILGLSSIAGEQLRRVKNEHGEPPKEKVK